MSDQSTKANETEAIKKTLVDAGIDDASAEFIAAVASGEIPGDEIIVEGPAEPEPTDETP